MENWIEPQASLKDAHTKGTSKMGCGMAVARIGTQMVVRMKATGIRTRRTAKVPSHGQIVVYTRVSSMITFGMALGHLADQTASHGLASTETTISMAREYTTTLTHKASSSRSTERTTMARKSSMLDCVYYT